MPETFRQEMIEEGILKIVFDLPDSRANIFTPEVASEMNQLVEQLRENSQVKIALIVSGKKDIFIAGADVNEILRITDRDDAYQKSKIGQDLFRKWEKLPFVTIALIDGACMGGGTEFSLACDFRFATDNPKTLIGLPEVKLGVLPGWGGTQRLPRLVNLQNALKLILTGNPVTARQAYRMHLVDEVLPWQAAEELALEMARQIRRNGGKRYLEKRKKDPLLVKLMEHFAPGRNLIFKKARESVMKQTRGHYPAPLRALEAVKYGMEHGFEKGLEFEARQFSELAISEISKNLIRLFLYSEDIKKRTGVDDPNVQPRPVRKIGILGAGVMGGGIGHLAASKGYPVRLKDIDYKPLGMALKHVHSLFADQVKRRRLTQREAELKMDLIGVTTDYSGFNDVDVVIEAVVEDVEIKKKVFAEVDQKTPAEAILASNTSAISITELARAVKHPNRFVGMHFFNPVHRMPLVEIIRGKHTDDVTIATIYDLAKKWGKTPIVVNDGPAFLVNRLLMPYMAEALALLEAGVPIQEVDKALVSFGMPMGPFRLYDEVGLDIAMKASRVVEKFLEARVYKSDILQKMIEMGRVGKKTNKGFYLHGGKHARVDENLYAILKIAKTMRMHPEEIVQRLVFIMINEAAYVLEEKIAAGPRDVDIGMIFGTGFAPFRGGPLRYADSIGIAEISGTLKKLAGTVGSRYEPAPLLQKMAGKGLGFYAYFKDDDF